jgi:hypothetical protein
MNDPLRCFSNARLQRLTSSVFVLWQPHMAPRNLQYLFSSSNPYRGYLVAAIVGLLLITAIGVLFVDENAIFLLLPPSVMYFWIDWSVIVHCIHMHAVANTHKKKLYFGTFFEKLSPLLSLQEGGPCYSARDNRRI